MNPEVKYETNERTAMAAHYGWLGEKRNDATKFLRIKADRVFNLPVLEEAAQKNVREAKIYSNNYK